MQSVDTGGIDNLLADFDHVLKEFPEGRRVVHERIGEMLKDVVDQSIRSSGLKDNSGKVRDWQRAFIGSRGGYAAVRAQGGKSGTDSPGAITNYLESGHKVRANGASPSTRRRWKVKAKKIYVDGFHFYQKAYALAEAEAIKEVESWADELAEMLGEE